MSLPSDEPPTERSPLLNDSASNQDRNESGAEPRQPQDDGGTDDETVLAKEPSTWELAAVMASIWVGTFLAALDSTLVATLTAPISTYFNSFSLVSWLASAFFIANAALQPLAGKLTDIYGRRAGLIFSNVFFCAGNLICGLAQSESAMILGRVVAGMGGGGLTAISTFVASDLIPLRRRGVWQGIGNICFGTGAALGGVFGGWINDTIGWRWAFYIQVPLTVLSGLVVFFTVRIPVKETEGSRLRRIDFLGAFTLILTLVLLLLGLNSGGNTVPWTHPLVLTTLPVSFLSFLLFIYIEACVSEEPIIPVRIMVNRTVLAACFTNWFGTMAIYGLTFYAPIYFQLRGKTPTQAGVRLVPQSVGIALGSVGSGIIIRSLGRYRMLNIFNQIIYVLSFVAICTFDLQTAEWPPFVYFFFSGTGYAGMLTVTLIALIASVDHKWQAVITSASYAFRSTGSTIGITISSAVFQNILKGALWARLGDREGAAEIIPRIRDSLDEIKNLPVTWQEPVTDAYMLALRGVFLTLAGFAVAEALVSLFMREHKLHTNLARRPSQ